MLSLKFRGLLISGAFLGSALLIPAGAEAKSLRLYSLEMMTLSSPQIALVRVTSVRDSWRPAPAMVGDRKVNYLVTRSLRGGVESRGSVVFFVGRGDPPPLVGDSLLVFRGTRAELGSGPVQIYHVTHTFNLSNSERAPLEWAISSDFRMIQNPDSILAAVARRLSWIRAGRPLGDGRRVTLKDFVEGRGCLERSIPQESEAQRATDFGSINSLRYPADAALLPSLMEATHHPFPDMRAWAAGSLSNYPRDSVVARLREMVADSGVTLTRYARSGAREDSVWVPVVHNTAVSALRALGADTTTANSHGVGR